MEKTASAATIYSMIGHCDFCDLYDESGRKVEDQELALYRGVVYREYHERWIPVRAYMCEQCANDTDNKRVRLVYRRTKV